VHGEPASAVGARRHGIGDLDIRHGFDHRMWIEDLDDGLLVVVGPNATGRLPGIGPSADSTDRSQPMPCTPERRA
jgi:hypothetical protein